MTEQKRILIFTADAGFGHRSAANAIAIALQEKHGNQCLVEIVNPMEDKRVPAFLRRSQADYDKIVQKVPDLYKLGFQASDASVPSSIVESALTVMLFETLRDVIQRHQPDVIIATYPIYQAPLSAIFTLSRRYIPLLTVVTDLAMVHRMWFHDAVDLCLVPTQAVYDQALQAGLSSDKVQITGIPVHPKLANPEHDLQALRAQMGWRNDLKTVLAVGSKRVKHLTQLLHTLNHSGMPIQLVVVAGGDDNFYQTLQETEWHCPAYLYNFVQNMPELLQAADCILCKAGGLIVTEALASGLPLVLVDVLQGQETGNVEYVVQGGAGELGETPLAVLEILCHWLEHGGEKLAQHAQKARELGRPRAAYDAADLAWAEAERGPHVKVRDNILAQSRLVALLNRANIPGEDL